MRHILAVVLLFATSANAELNVGKEPPAGFSPVDGDSKKGVIDSVAALRAIPLQDSLITLSLPAGWSIRGKEGEIGGYPPDQKSSLPPRRIHLVRVKMSAVSLQQAIDAEIDRVTIRSPKWGSSNDRQAYKGSTAVRTASGLEGLRADFWNENPDGKSYAIVKYYFFDEQGNIFKVCSHVRGDQKRFDQFESAILSGLR